MSAPVQRKPVDIGNGRVTASFATDGSWLSAGGLHPDTGLVELVAAPAFAATDGDGQAVRAHRHRLADPAWAVLEIMDAEGAWDSRRTQWYLNGAGWSATTEAWTSPGGDTLVQHHLLSTDGPGSLRLRWRGRIDRPGYAMITPVGPTPEPLAPTRLTGDGPVLHLQVAGAEPPVRARVEVDCHHARLAGWEVTADGAELEVRWDGVRDDVSLTLRVAPTDATACAVPEEPGTRAGAPGVPAASTDEVLDLLEAGAARYTRDCTAVAVSDDACCLTTDHRLLPLSWTRDAYYQAVLLLARGDSADLEVAERHLAWLWTRGRDDDGVWQRSHFVTGEVKDSVFQADQQLYPLLELADFRRTTGRWPSAPGVGWAAEVRRVWNGLPRDETGLVPGAENPADDPSELPYLLSSQLLLAYVCTRLFEWEDELDLHDLALQKDYTGLVDRIEETFRCDGPFGVQWGYESDGAGKVSLYHDANDVPTACAPIWGLCSSQHLPWRNTMRFAWSTHNPGFVPGRYGGLGSRHTPGVWPLGDAQEWAVAMLVGDHQTADRLVDKVRLVASGDGMLPETYDPETAEWWARDWFAWPGSLFGILSSTLRRRRGPWSGAPCQGTS